MMKLSYEQAAKKLASCGQGHVLSQWKKLSAKARADLLAQVESIDPKSIARCRVALTEGAASIDNSKGVAPKAQLLSHHSGSAIQPGCQIVVPSKKNKNKLSTAEILSIGSSSASIAAVVATIANILE